MKKQFVVSWTQPSWHQQWLTVEAETEKEAVQKVKDMSPISQAEGDEFLHNGDQQDFQVDQTRTRLLKEATPERTKMAADILTAALEGGSNYWIEKHKWVTNEENLADRRVLPYLDGYEQWINGSAQLIVTEQDTNTHYVLLPYDLLARAEWVAEQKGMNLFQLWQQHDACDADDILQLACFGEIIYC
jgi:hypothetical protein